MVAAMTAEPLARPRGAPTLRFERELLRRGFASLAAVDEVGRGSLCGPVTVGVVVIRATTGPAPTGVRDSKLLAPPVRERLAPLIRAWAPEHAVGHAGSDEIDQLGLMAALRLAGMRALAALPAMPDVILLDGNHDYLTPPSQPSLFDDSTPDVEFPAVVTRVKADLRCAGVAAASVLAKTARDSIMTELAAGFPAYGWAENKGYAAPDHLAALRRLGPTPHHRLSWNLPEQGVDIADVAG